MTEMMKDFVFITMVLWIIGVFSTRRNESIILLRIPSRLSRLLFLQKIKKSITIETIVYQILVYVICISLSSAKLLGLLDMTTVMKIYSFVVISLPLLYLIISLLDYSIYKLKQR